jgi:Flp pilus assembly pilin Flp
MPTFLVVLLPARVVAALVRRDQRGQAASEYALVLVAVGILAGLVIKWASGTGKVQALLDAVLDGVLRRTGE